MRLDAAGADRLVLFNRGLGVGEAIELARALGQLPRRLILVGVDAKSLCAGAPLTVQVADRLDDAVREVAEALTATRNSPASPRL